MELEYFDEPRQCSKCKIVTYCDRCPICGKLLPRTSYRLKKFGFFQTAGEEEIRQPKNHGVHQGHILERVSTRNHPYQSADHVNPELDIASAPTHTMRPVIKKQRQIKRRSRKTRKLPSITAVIIIMTVIAFLFGVLDGTEEDTHFYDDTEHIEQDIRNETEESAYRDAIAVSEYVYSETDQKSTLTMKNNNVNAYLVDLILYDENDQEVGSYENLSLLPYEYFDLTIFSTAIADSYELKNCIAYEIGSTKPDISYQTYQESGSIDVYTEESFGKLELEILIRYLYEANETLMNEALYSIYIYMPDSSSYEVYLDEKDASCYLYDEDDVLSDAFDFTFDDKEIEGSSF